METSPSQGARLHFDALPAPLRAAIRDDKFETHSYSESQVCQPKLCQTYYTKYDTSTSVKPEIL